MTTADAGDTPTSLPEARPNGPPGGLLDDVVAAFFAPAALFDRLPAHNRAAAALLVLLLAHVLYALGVISTGVVDYETGARAEREIARQTAHLPGDDPADDPQHLAETLEKGAAFTRMLTRVLLLVAGPARVLCGVGVLAGILFVVVALSGATKADFSLLAGVAVFAAFAEVPRLLLRLLLIAGVHASRVETSLAAFADVHHVGLAGFLFLRRLDPFDAWYWALVALGLCRTGQLRLRWAVTVVVALALLTALLQCMMEVGDLAEIKFNLDPNAL
jgi:Yip1 domain